MDSGKSRMVLGSAKHQAGKNCIQHVRLTFFQSLNAVFKPHVFMCLVPSHASAFDSQQACTSTHSKQQCYNMTAQSGRPQFQTRCQAGQIISSSEMYRILILHHSTWPVERQQTSTHGGVPAAVGGRKGMMQCIDQTFTLFSLCL